MRLALLFTALCLSSSAVAAEKPFERTFHARVSVTAEGAVAAVEPQDGLPAPVAQLIGDAAGKLAFEPATVQGTPVASRTTVLVRTRFAPGQGDALDARVLSITEAQPMMRPPVYPFEAMRAGVNALVWLRVSVGPDGAVDTAGSSVESVDARYANGRKLGRGKQGEALGQAALAAAAQWLVYPEEVDGVAQATELRVPVTFCMPSDSAACRQFKEMQGSPERSSRDPGVRLAQLKPAGEPQES